MRIVVSEMPKEPYKCEYCRDDSNMDYDKYICTFRKEEHRCIFTRDCPYFVSFKEMFEDKISNYDCQEYDEYRWG